MTDKDIHIVKLKIERYCKPKYRRMMARELGSGRYFNSGMGKHRQETKDDGNRFNEYMTDKKKKRCTRLW